MWSKNYDKCRGCDSDSAPHMARGLCTRCYLSDYARSKKNKKRIREAKDRWYRKNVTAETRRIAREQRNYGGMRQAVLERDGRKCVRCEATELLTVHHKDGKGRGCPSPDNGEQNLETLCRPCHARLHSKASGWARDYDSCVACGTTERKHNAKGLCWKCYPRREGHEDSIP